MLNFREFARMFHSTPLWMDNTKILLSKLRKKTGYTFINCKKALEVCNNDLAQAEKWLNEQALTMGWEKANKLAERPAFQGLIGISSNEKSAAMVEVNCETDFVAKNGLFQNYVFNVADTCFSLAKKQTQFEDFVAKSYLNSSDLKTLQLPEGKTLDDEAALLVSQVGEKVSLRRAICLNLSDNLLLTSCTHPYISPNENDTINAGRFGAVLIYKAENPSPDTSLLAKQLCQHIIGMNPEKIGNSEDDEPKENKEAETVMIHQEFIMDPEVTVLQVLLENGMTLKDFVRFQMAEDLKEEVNHEDLKLAQVAE